MRARLRFIAAAMISCACSSPAGVVDGGSDAALVDVGVSETSKDASDGGSCTDGVKSGAETDVDCGGSACPKCKDGNTCAKETDCESLTCSNGTCGVRAWSIESSGSDLSVPGDQTWVDGASSGLYLTPNLYAQSLVFLRWTGTLRYAGGGNGICHVGQRFVIDDVPTGEPTWGNAIMVENGATRWQETFTTETAIPLGLGLHTIGVQMTNAMGYANCTLDGDEGAAYDRSRLAVSAYDTKNAWYVEATAEASLLGSNSFVDIPGLALTINLPANRHVQMSMTGTQLVQGVTPGTGEGYCAYQLVIDGAPLGDAAYGQALYVGDVASGWWAPVALKYGQDLTAGSHTISVRMGNRSAQATCVANQGNNAYARFRMFVSSSVTGGPNASVESTGGPDILGSSSAWTDIGLATTFNIASPTHAQLELAATEETLTGSGHCSWHFVIDGLPLGDPSYGQAINVGSAATTWWTTTALLWGQSFDPGSHTVSVQIRNSSSTGDCGTNGDALPYGRARLLVRVP